MYIERPLTSCKCARPKGEKWEDPPLVSQCRYSFCSDWPRAFLTKDFTFNERQLEKESRFSHGCRFLGRAAGKEVHKVHRSWKMLARSGVAMTPRPYRSGCLCFPLHGLQQAAKVNMDVIPSLNDLMQQGQAAVSSWWPGLGEIGVPSKCRRRSERKGPMRGHMAELGLWREDDSSLGRIAPSLACACCRFRLLEFSVFLLCQVHCHSLKTLCGTMWAILLNTESLEH